MRRASNRAGGQADRICRGRARLVTDRPGAAYGQHLHRTPRERVVLEQDGALRCGDIEARDQPLGRPEDATELLPIPCEISAALLNPVVVVRLDLAVLDDLGYAEPVDPEQVEAAVVVVGIVVGASEIISFP